MHKARPARPALLVVDDDPNVAAPIAEIAESAGFRALTAANGREALEILEVEELALMLVDLFMPVMSGVELLKAVKASPRLAKIPRVIMTGTNDPMIRIREDSTVLYKPIDLESLSAVLQKHGQPVTARVENDGSAGSRRGGRLEAFRRRLSGHPLLFAFLFMGAVAAATVVATVRSRGVHVGDSLAG